MAVLVPAEVRRQLARPPAPAAFSEAELDGLPQVVRRHLRAAIGPSTPLATSARLGMRGQLRLGRWLPFQAEQVLAPHHGFYWAARVAGLISGFDRYLDGHGKLRWKLLGVVPVTQANGPDVARSAVGRAAGEAMWLPTALLPRFGVEWQAADDRHVMARFALDGVAVDLHYELEDDGRIRSVVFDRWGDPDRSGAWGLHPFGGEVTGYRTFSGLTVPSAGRIGWFYGTDRWPEGEFFRFQLTDLEPMSASSYRCRFRSRTATGGLVRPLRPALCWVLRCGDDGPGGPHRASAGGRAGPVLGAVAAGHPAAHRGFGRRSDRRPLRRPGRPGP